MAHFGEILADLRRDKGLQQKELGKELHIAGSTISSYERGINLPNADRIIQIANYFDVTTDYLLGRTPYNVPPTIINKPFVNGLTKSRCSCTVRTPTDGSARSVCAFDFG